MFRCHWFGAGTMFCQKCGRELVSASKDSATPTIGNVTSVSFDNFLKRKAICGANNIVRTQGRQGEDCKEFSGSETETRGNNQYRNHETELRRKTNKCRGKTLPLKVTATASENDILFYLHQLLYWHQLFYLHQLFLFASTFLFAFFSF